ncbi:MAG: 30S ribosomal protein S3 [Candidatus Omnitrophica bacterium]|nr:30S ribosomal protein S3 [Candidatus Omnitrophota bacterium]
MGQKVHPLVLRLGYTKNWRSLWFAKKGDFANNINQDFKIRKFIREKFDQAAVSMIIIERLADQIKVRIHTARPGVIIGRRGADIDRLRSELKDITGKDMDKIVVDIQEIKNPNIDAQLVAQGVAFQLEKRVAFRRAMKRAIEQSRAAGAKGIKIRCAGRLGGAEMARTEKYHEGKVPLQTLRADIDYGFAEAKTTYGLLGIKVWIYKGDVIKDQEEMEAKAAAATATTTPQAQEQSSAARE